MKRLVILVMIVIGFGCTNYKAPAPKQENPLDVYDYINALVDSSYRIHNGKIAYGNYDNMKTDQQYVFSVKKDSLRETLKVFRYDLEDREVINNFAQNGVKRSGHHGSRKVKFIKNKNLLLEVDTSHKRWESYKNIFLDI